MVYEGGGRAEIVEKVRWAQATPEVARQLRVIPGDVVVVIKRIGYSGGQPLAWIINYLPYDIGVKVYDDDQDLERNPMVALLQEKYGIPLTRAVQTIEAVLAEAEIAERLGIPVGTPVLQAERVYFSTRGQPVQFTRSWYRADRYKYTVTLRGWKRRRRRRTRRA
jgi:GntR family transcriptional regulator